MNDKYKEYFNIPDNPNSLFEGVLGYISFLNSIENVFNDKNFYFPCYDLPYYWKFLDI
jgi:hypothetical protein